MRRRQLNSMLCALAILAPTLSAAADRPVVKAPPREAELAKKESTKIPEKDLAGDITRKKKAKVEDRPALEYDQFRLGVEVQVASKRREQIETLQKIIQLGPSEREAPSLSFRLAELYWEESKFYFFEANRKDDDIIKAKVAKDDARVAQAEAEKQAVLKKSDSYQQLAIDQYRTVLKKYPKYERMDEVLFFLGHNMWESGKEKDAITVYGKLLRDYPKSRYQPDAFVAVGQHYFNNSNGKREDLDRALEAFKRAETYTENKVYGYAIYMQGWCLTNLGDHRGAMDKFKAVILYGELQGKADNRSTSLSKEARKDFVVAYSHAGDMLSAKTEFQKVGGDEHWWTMLKGLAGLYYDEGKDKEATLIYNQLLKERPTSAEAPFFQGRIVDCVMRVGNKKVTVNQVRELVRVIQGVEKAGAVKTADEKKAFQEARELSERALSNLAVNWHNEAKKTRQDEVFLLASEVYQDYLEVFAQSPKAYDLRFFFAELLNDNLSRFDRAAEEYTKVVLADIGRLAPSKAKDGSSPPPEKPGRWLVNAAYNAVLAYDEVAKRYEKDEVLPKTDGKSKLPIPAPKQSLIDACERYLKYATTGDKQVEVTYKAANTYYRYSHFDRAVALFSEVALKHPKSELAEYSANLVLDCFNLQNDFSKVNAWARKFNAVPDLAKGKFKDDLASVLEQSSLKLVAVLEERDDFGGAAEAYLSFVREFPRSSLADLALFNASVDYFKARQIDRSIEVRRHMTASYPDSKYVPQCVFANGEAYEAVADFEAAAETYEKYGDGYARARAAAKGKGRGASQGKPGTAADGAGYEEAKAQVALFNAGVFREGLAQIKEAAKDRTLYLELWPDGKDSESVFLSIADLYEKAGVLAKAVSHLEDYQRRYASTEPDRLLAAQMRIARLFEKQGDQKGAQRAFERLLESFNKVMKSQPTRLGPAGLEAGARATLFAAERPFADYEKLVLPADERKLKAALEGKQKALLELQRRYTEVVGYKAADPAICALYRIGLAYRNFADVLNGAPVPEMPVPAQLNPIKHLLNVPWAKWPKQYREAMPEADFQNIQQQLAEAKEQFGQAYRDQILQLAQPVEEKAADAFATTVEKARELSIYNDCAAKAHDLLSERYKPTQYPKVVEMLAEVKVPKEARQGNGILSVVQPVPVAPPRPRERRDSRDERGTPAKLEDGTNDTPSRKAPEDKRAAEPEDSGLTR